MREIVAISAGDLCADIVPSLGAGLARFDLTRGGRRRPIFRPWPEQGTDDPNSLAAYVLVPWSNRISGGGFEFGGKFHPLEPNFPTEPLPLHGNGWTSEWTLAEAAADWVTLELPSEGPGPFRYLARLRYELTSETLTVRLDVTNRAQTALPYGLGFHPWLPRTPDTRLQAHAETIWLEDERHLPTRKIPVIERPDWNFDSLRLLPNGWINNGFEGWDRRAHIEWPSRGLSLSINASERLGSYLLYSPSRKAPFFCFEPVSHIVDAHNLPGGPAANGLVFLATNEMAEISCRFSPHQSWNLSEDAPANNLPVDVGCRSTVHWLSFARRLEAMSYCSASDGPLPDRVTSISLGRREDTIAMATGLGLRRDRTASREENQCSRAR